jgi:hypothetical protein
VTAIGLSGAVEWACDMFILKKYEKTYVPGVHKENF